MVSTTTLSNDERCAERTASELFAIVWKTVAEVIGTAATATLMRRSAKRATAAGAPLDGLLFERRGFDYAYSVPTAWAAVGRDEIHALRVLVRELTTLLQQLTGPVLVRRLEANPELVRAQLFNPCEAA